MACRTGLESDICCASGEARRRGRPFLRLTAPRRVAGDPSSRFCWLHGAGACQEHYMRRGSYQRWIEHCVSAVRLACSRRSRARALWTPGWRPFSASAVGNGSASLNTLSANRALDGARYQGSASGLAAVAAVGEAIFLKSLVSINLLAAGRRAVSLTVYRLKRR